MLKAINIRLYLSDEQKIFINRQLGCCRLLYNSVLAWRNELYEVEKRSPSSQEISKFVMFLKNEKPFLREVHSKVLQQSLIDLNKAYSNFFRGLKKGQNIGFPKFKSKKTYNESCRFPVDAFIGVNGNRISIVKSLSNIHFKCSRRDERYLNKRQDSVKSVTVRRNSANQYYASVLVDYDIVINKDEDLKGDVGIDVGLKHFLVTSDGVVYERLVEYNKEYKHIEKQIKKLQRQMSKTENDSKRHHKIRRLIAKKHLKLANIRLYYHHLVANELLRENQTIFIENLNVGGMMKNHKLARAIQEHGLSSFFNILKYKSLWLGKEIIEIGRFYASSKICSKCGYRNQNMALSIREWVCPECGKYHDRDINAAENILQEGLKIKYG